MRLIASVRRACCASPLAQAYLDDEEFERVLGSPRHVFNEMPNWKRTSIKRDKGLF